jgi:metal-sulfur cluster biosynthetic enzyme
VVGGIRTDPRELVVRSALEEVADPEIPAVSVIELGVIGEVAFEALGDGGERLTVELLPGGRRHARPDR